MAAPARPLLLDIERRAWGDYLDRAEEWLETAALLQAAFRKMLDDTVDDVSEPHIRKWLADMREGARRHEATINEVYVALGRDRPPPGEARAGLLAKARELVGHVEGIAAGARGGGWRSMRELMLANLDSIGGFAVTEQIGLALALPGVVDLVVPVIHQKHVHQMVLRECYLEMAPNAILYRRDV
jgi:anti-sigma factor RsiW